MSGNTASPVPTFTIAIGAAGTFTNDAAVNIAPALNAAIAAAPAGEKIDIVFNPGTYGVGGTILLPSNTSVTGNDATLQFLQIAGQNPNFGALIANKDAHTAAGVTHVNLINGTSIAVQSWNPSGTTCANMAGTVAAIVDSNISVQNLTFSLGNSVDFSTWFTDATDIDVQNNTYIGGMDANALVDVVNAVVAGNIAIGQTNAAFDDWNGPVNITIEDNATYMSAAPGTGWSVLLNSTPSGDPNNYGNAVNDGIIGNLFASGAAGQNAVNANALASYGFTYESLIAQQGNIDSINGQAGQTDVYSGGALRNLIIQNNITSGLDNAAGVTQSSTAFAVLGNTATGTTATTGTWIDGNTAEGNFSNGQTGIIQNTGDSPVTANNAELGAGASSLGILTSPMNGTFHQTGNLSLTGGTLAGAAAAPPYDITAPATAFVTPDSPTVLTGIAIEDQNAADTLSVTLLSQFGTLSLATAGLTESSSVAGGETATTITGAVAALNAALGGLTYTSNAAGWDDSIEILLTNDASLLADRYVPVIDLSGTEIRGGLISLTTGQLELMGLDSIATSLSGGAILASTGTHAITMDAMTSLVFLGAGQDSVTGGADAGYITTGEGDATINLIGGGDFTIAGGPGHLTVNAAAGDNLIEPGAATAAIIAGAGANTVLGGLGNLSFNSGTGLLLLETLPQDGGTLSGTIGAGGGTIYALSGNATLTTTTLASDDIYLGLGQNTLFSAGDDIIHTGAGAATISATGGGTDLIFGGTGQLTFIGGANPAVIDPANVSTLTDNAGNLTVLSDGNFNLNINSIANAARVVVLPGLSDGITLSGYGQNPIVGETLAAGTLAATLTDGTVIELPDPTDYALNLVAPQSAATGAKIWQLEFGQPATTAPATIGTSGTVASSGTVTASTTAATPSAAQKPAKPQAAVPVTQPPPGAVITLFSKTHFHDHNYWVTVPVM